MKYTILGVLLLTMNSCSVTFNVGSKKSKATSQPVEIPLDKVAPVGEFVAFDMIDDEQLIYVMIEQDGKLVCSEMLGKDFKNAFTPPKESIPLEEGEVCKD